MLQGSLLREQQAQAFPCLAEHAKEAHLWQQFGLLKNYCRKEKECCGICQSTCC